MKPSYSELWSLLLFARSLHNKFSPIRDGFTSWSPWRSWQNYPSICLPMLCILPRGEGKERGPAGKKKDRSCRGMKEGTGLRQARCKGRRDEKGKSKSKGHTRSVHCKIGACGTRNLRYRRAMQSCLEPPCLFPFYPLPPSSPPLCPFSAPSFFGFPLLWRARAQKLIVGGTSAVRSPADCLAGLGNLLVKKRRLSWRGDVARGAGRGRACPPKREWGRSFQK